MIDKSTRRNIKMFHSPKSLSYTILLASVSLLLLQQLAIDQAEAGGKGGGEGNIIISTGGGQSTKIKIMKVPVPFPVIKHVPYPVPVPIIQKKYIPVYKHFEHHGGHEHQGGFESQQNEQYGSPAGSAPAGAHQMGSSGSSGASGSQESTSSTNTANIYESANQIGQYGNQPIPMTAAGSPMIGSALQVAAAQQYQQMYGRGGGFPGAEGFAQGIGSPFAAAQMAAAASQGGYDAGSVYSGSSGYTVGYGNGSPAEYSQSAYGLGQASSNGYDAYPGLYGGAEDSSLQQYAGSQNQQINMAGSPFMYHQPAGEGRDLDSIYNQPSSSSSIYHHSPSTSSSPSSSSAANGPAVSSSGSAASSGSSGRHSISGSALGSSNSASGSGSTSGGSTSSSTSSSVRQNRGSSLGKEQVKGEWSSASSYSGKRDSQAAVSPSGSSGSSGSSVGRNKVSGLKQFSNAHHSGASGQSSEMMAVSSTPTAYHLSSPNSPIKQQQQVAANIGQQQQRPLIITNSSEQKSDLSRLNRQQQPSLSTPIVPATSIVSQIVPSLQQQQQQQQQKQQTQSTGTNLNSSQAGHSQQGTQLFSGSLLSASPIMQHIRKFTNDLTNSTQSVAQQAIGSSTAGRLLG